MDNQSSFSRYILVVLCVSVVLTALILVILNSWVKNKSLGNLNYFAGGSYDQGYKDGYLAAREKFQSVTPAQTNSPVFSVGGTIQSASKKAIELKVASIDVNELVDGVSDVRKANITSQTKIIKRTPMDPVAFGKKVDQWNKAGGATKGLEPPVPYTDVAISAGDLKTGMKATVAANEDVRLKDEFTATQIIVFP